MVATNNPIELFNGEIKATDQGSQDLSQQGSLLRLVRVLCMERSGGWTTGRRHANGVDVPSERFGLPLPEVSGAVDSRSIRGQ